MARPKSNMPWLERRKTAKGLVWVGRWRVYRDGVEVARPARTIGSTKDFSRFAAMSELMRILNTEPAAPPKTEPLTWAAWRRKIEPVLAAGWRYNTRFTMKSALDRWDREVGTKLLSSVTKLDLQTVLLKLGESRSSSTVICTLAAARALLAEAVDNDLIPKDPSARIVVAITPGKKTRLLAQDEFVRVLGLPGRVGLMARLAGLCGLRSGEILALKRECVADRRIVVRRTVVRTRLQEVTKGGRNRVVPCPPGLWRDLQAWMATSPYQAPEAFVFHTGSGHHILSRDISLDILPEMRNGSGTADLSFRMLRHAYSTYLRAEAADVQAMLGHARLETTLAHYREGIPERQQAAADELEARVTVQ